MNAEGISLDMGASVPLKLTRQAVLKAREQETLFKDGSLATPYSMWLPPAPGLKARVAAAMSSDAGLGVDEASGILSSWAIGCTLAIQVAASREFDVDMMGDHPELSPAEDVGTPKLRLALRSVYDRTQEFLASRGVKSLSLFRGMSWTLGEAPPSALAGGISCGVPFEAELQTWPLSSFSCDVFIAGHFAAAFSPAPAVVLAAKVPATRVLSLPHTGLGCLKEAEAVVLGGRFRCMVYPLDGDGRMASGLPLETSSQWHWTSVGP